MRFNLNKEITPLSFEPRTCSIRFYCSNC